MKNKKPDKPTYLELEKDLRDARAILDTLRNQKADAIVGIDNVSVLRLKEMEDQLYNQIQISENRLKEIESIYQNVPVGLCILDSDLKIVRINEHLSRIHGIPADDHMGLKISELIPDLAGDIDPELHQVLETGEARMNVELHGKTPADPDLERCLLEHWLPIKNEQGEIIGINMVIEEITEQKRFEEELQQLNSTLEKKVAERTKIAEERADKLREMALQMAHVEERERQRLARVLHDGLQQLLIGAKFNLKLMGKRISSENDVLEEQVNQIIEILDQSIDASRSLSYELSPPILHDHGLLAALEWLTEMRHMQGLSVKIHYENQIPELTQSLKVFLFQSVRELLVNVIKHAGTDKASVRLSCDNDDIKVEVIDGGKGFDTAKIKSGTFEGMGLRSIREKLDLMNGKFKINSKPGGGSHFILQVPFEENYPASSTIKTLHSAPIKITGHENKPANQTSLSHGMISVLVVDDHQVMRNGLVSLLSDESDIRIVGEASNGLEAVDLAKKLQPDVIIMDITMPEMDGIEAARIIHLHNPNIRIIGLSMHEEEEYASLMKKAGAADFLNKGGPAARLFASIRFQKDDSFISS